MLDEDNLPVSAKIDIPYVRKMTASMRKKICREIERCGGNITHACRRVGISRFAFYTWMKKDTPSAIRFQKDVEEARRLGIDYLEDEAVRRAYDGWEEPVFYQGAEVGNIRKYSDNLLMFLIRGHKKHYVDRYEFTGPDGKPIQTQSLNINLSTELKNLSRDDLEQLQRIASVVKALSDKPGAS